MIRAQLQAHGLTDEQLSRAHTLTMPELTTTEDDCSEYAAPILPKHVPMLRKICMDLDIRMVVIDTLVDCIGGANSNNRDDMAKVVAALNHWAASDNILVVSIHHNIKGNDGTAKQAAAGAGHAHPEVAHRRRFRHRRRPVRSVVAAPLLPVAEDQGARRPPVVRIQVLVQDHDDGRRHHRESSLCDRGAAVRREHRRVAGQTPDGRGTADGRRREKRDRRRTLWVHPRPRQAHVHGRRAEVGRWQGMDGQESSQGVPGGRRGPDEATLPASPFDSLPDRHRLVQGREGQGPRTGGAAVGHTRKVWKLWQV